MPAVYSPTTGGWLDATTGLPLTHAELTAIRDAFLDEIEAEFRALVETELGEPEQFVTWPAFAVDRWARTFTEKIREVAIRAYGGVSGGLLATIPERGWDTIAGVLDRQTPFAARFIQDVRGGTLSAAEVSARSELYTSAALETWGRGQLVHEAPGFDAPGMPGELCLGSGRCRCFWRIEETDTEYRGYWQANGDDQTCDRCINASREWSPYVQPKG